MSRSFAGRGALLKIIRLLQHVTHSAIRKRLGTYWPASHHAGGFEGRDFGGFVVELFGKDLGSVLA